MSFNYQPPLSNRGVQNTTGAGLITLVDWVQLTFKKIQFSSDVIALLGLDLEHFTVLDKGLNGWKRMYATKEEEIKILQDGNDTTRGMTQLIMSGQGCRFFEKHSSTNWIDFFAVIQNTDVNYRRLDIAVDDYEGYVTPSKVYRKIKQKSVTSKFRKGRWIESFDLNDYERNGTTLYCGSPQSDIQVRFYDKLKEREDKNFIVDSNVTHWTRVELQLRKERAHAAALNIAFQHSTIGELASGTLANYITFRVRDKKERNKSRWVVCEWWTKFLRDSEKIALTIKVDEPKMEKTVDWAQKQWSKSVYMMYEAFNNDIDFMFKLLERGSSQMTEKDFLRILDFKDKYGNISFEEFLEKKEKTNRLDDSLDD